MTLFTILEPPGGQPEKVAVIPEGFSVRAAVFTVLWALWHRMWVVAVLLFVLSVALQLSAMVFRLDSALVFCAILAMALLFGFEGRSLHIQSLKRAGYRVAGLISAENAESAELQYFSKRASRAPQKPVAPIQHGLPAMGQHHDALGLFGSH